jgi:hypothetical protein
MEVHHHPDLHHKKKRWKEYFLEFLMIFLAVTMGFFAESYREHLVNAEKEKHYAKGLFDDLRKDTTNINHLINQQSMLVVKIDNALEIPMSKMMELPAQESFYKNFIYFYSFVPVFFRNESTITQLKSGGGFNVFPNQSLVDSISRLDNFYDKIKYNNDWYIKSCDYVDNTANQFMIIQKIPSDFNDSLLAAFPQSTKLFANYDSHLIIQLYNTIKVERSMLDLLIAMENNYKEKCISLLNYLTQEYPM